MPARPFAQGKPGGGWSLALGRLTKPGQGWRNKQQGYAPCREGTQTHGQSEVRNQRDSRQGQPGEDQGGGQAGYSTGPGLFHERFTGGNGGNRARPGFFPVASKQMHGVGYRHQSY